MVMGDNEWVVRMVVNVADLVVFYNDIMIERWNRGIERNKCHRHLREYNAGHGLRSRS